VRRTCLILVLVVAGAGIAGAEAAPVVLDRDGSTVVLEPYAPNIIRVTLSLNKDGALAAPGYGFVAKPTADGGHGRGEPSRQSDGDAG
jgi:alpha-D-xyloside xylohydrolase